MNVTALRVLIGATQRVRSSATVFALGVIAAALMTAGAAQPSEGAQTSPTPRPPARVGQCTMAMPALHATIEVRMANADDLCELASQALAGEVFRSSVIVTPGGLWHYADSVLSCRLRYAHGPYRITIRNAPAACRWFERSATAWRGETD
jgi:hypothetical protein